VFAESARRAWLEALLHPRVREAWTLAIAEDPGADWVVEIPLLFEKKLETSFDLVVCLSSSLNNQLSRLRLRGLSEVDAMARISSQAPLAEKIENSEVWPEHAGANRPSPQRLNGSAHT
jgi:dephospho-CoA kinase